MPRTDAAPPEHLAKALLALERRYRRRFLASDPLRFPHGYEAPADREVAAVVAALLAFGRVASIGTAVGRALEALGTRPARTLARTPPRRLASGLAPLVHRWVRGEDVAWLLESVRAARRAHGSLGAFLLASARSEEPLRTALSAWHDLAHASPTGADPARGRARAFLLPDVRGGGACKRLLLLARWCVRPADGLDLGLWRGEALRPADLLVPLDVHVHRTALDLGLTRRPRADWHAAQEVTAALRRVDPEDPVRFDFALARPGILGHCRHAKVTTLCSPCVLRGACRHGETPLSPPNGSRRSPRSPGTTHARSPCS